jgi:hypothetical protein
MSVHQDSRMYEAKYPEVDDVVMVQVRGAAAALAFVCSSWPCTCVIKRNNTCKNKHVACSLHVLIICLLNSQQQRALEPLSC